MEVPKHESGLSLGDARSVVDYEDYNFVPPSVYIANCDCYAWPTTLTSVGILASDFPDV